MNIISEKESRGLHKKQPMATAHNLQVQGTKQRLRRPCPLLSHVLSPYLVNPFSQRKNSLYPDHLCNNAGKFPSYDHGTISAILGPSICFEILP